MVFCVLITSNTLRNEHFLDELHSQVLLSLTIATVDSHELEKTKERRCKLLHTLKKKVLTRYLSARYVLCLDFMEKRLNSSPSKPAEHEKNEGKTECDKECKNTGEDEKDEHEKKEMNASTKEENVYEQIRLHCFGYIRYYHYVMSARDTLICINASKPHTDRWQRVLHRTQQMAEILTRSEHTQNTTVPHNSNHNGDVDRQQTMRRELVGFLSKIAQIIEGKLAECRHKMQQKEKESKLDEQNQAMKVDSNEEGGGGGEVK